MLPSTIDLVYFNEVATKLHFSQAAKMLNVSQPSLSLAIKRLEKLLGTSLFIRHKQGVTLTRVGVEFLKDVKKILIQLDRIVADVKNVNQSIKGRVNIGCHSTLAPFMSQMVSRLLESHPGLEIHFQHALSNKILEDVVQGHLDIGIATDPYPHPDVVLQKMADTEFAFWISTQQNTKLDLLAEETVFICDPQLSPTQYLIKELLKQTQHKQLKLSTMNNLEAIAAMTAEGYGIGILPSGFTGRFFGDKLRQIPNAPIYLKPLCLAYRSENKDVIVVKIVLEAMRELAKVVTQKSG